MHTTVTKDDQLSKADESFEQCAYKCYSCQQKCQSIARRDLGKKCRMDYCDKKLKRHPKEAMQCYNCLRVFEKPIVNELNAAIYI